MVQGFEGQVSTVAAGFRAPGLTRANRLLGSDTTRIQRRSCCERG